MRQLGFCFLLWALLTACHSGPSKHEPMTPTPDPATVYNPHLSTLVIRSEIDYPTGFKATLYDDKERVELASVEASDGNFVLETPELAVNEVYFLKLEGTRRAFGMDGMTWEERVPVYFDHKSGNLNLIGTPYRGMESVSQMRFHIEGGEVQEELNQWQAASDKHAAAVENQIAQRVTWGGGTVSTKQSRRETLRDGLERITKDFIKVDSPNVAALFLIYRQQDHRQQHEVYQSIYHRASPNAQQSKYGADLMRRIAKIHTPADSIRLEGHSVLADGRLMPLDTAALGSYPYWLLYFWSTRDLASMQGIPEVYEAIKPLDPTQVVPIFISVDEVFSRWREKSQDLGLEHSYLIRRGARQGVVNTLYLERLPRAVLVEAGGSVLEDDVDLEALSRLLLSN